MATEKGKSVTDWKNAADSGTPTVFYRTVNVEGLEIFYREAGPSNAPTVLLLHGFPSSSHMFRTTAPHVGHLGQKRWNLYGGGR